MFNAAVRAVIALVALVLLLSVEAGAQMSGSDPKEVYLGLRQQALGGSRTKFRLQSGHSPVEPWGVLMDTGLKDGKSYTVLALSDGTASIYFSTGGGFIGGQGIPAVKASAQRLLEVASKFQPSMSLVSAYPLPGAGQTTFYLLSDQGVYSASAPEEALGQQRASLSPLFNAAQDVVTQFRLSQKGK